MRGLLLMLIQTVAVPTPAAPPPVPVEKMTASDPVAARQIDIPDEIAPAVMPYMQCLFVARGGELQITDDRRPRSRFRKGDDCSGQRRASARDADRLLNRLGRGTAPERAAYVERVLKGIDVFSGDSTPGTALPKGDSLPVRTMTVASVSYPEAIAAQVHRYKTCIEQEANRRLKDESWTTDILRAAYANARLVCVPVRAQESSAADEILRGEGTAPVERARIVATVFDDIERRGEQLAVQIDQMDAKLPR